MKWIVGLALCVGAWDAATSHAATPESPPNVLLLFMDDQQADTIAALGNEHLLTPNLDRLVRSGISMDRAYMQGSMNGATCVPSRAMLLSGRGLFHVDEKLLAHPNWVQAFGEAGYRTFITGKWHNGTEALSQSFQAGGGISTLGMGNPMKSSLSSLVDGQLTAATPEPQHSCARFTDEALGFLSQGSEQPFFCYVSFDGPHDPHIVPERFPIKYHAGDIPLPANFLAQHPFNNGEMTIRDELLLPWPRQPDAVRAMIAEYYRYISFLDVQIGRILDQLERSSFRDNTIVVFTSDSGVARGRHGLIGKQNLYEHSIRVPLIFAGPGIARNARSKGLCYLYDVLPTLGGMCGVAAPDGSEGVDFQATLRDPATPIRDHLVFGYKSSQRAICNAKWKLIRYPNIDVTQLFDLANDPDERTDLSSKAVHAGVLESLRKTLMGDLSELGDKAPWTEVPTKPASWQPPSKLAGK
ncbi:MAG: sulfatase-like hydrolase/transferase [Pirellula sp.]